MRQFITTKNLMLFLAPVSLFLLASCGSSQYSGYESDGIYGGTNRSQERGYERQNQNATQNAGTGSSSYYQNLFAEEAALYGDLLADGAIFTDVDSYSSHGEYDYDEEGQGYVSGRAPWGNDPDSYAVNIYNMGGFYGGFMNPYMGWGWDPFMMHGMGFGWGGMGFGWGGMGMGHWGMGMGRWGMGFGMNRWGMGMGHWGMMHPYGFGWGMGGFGHPFFMGGGYFNPYNFYGNRYNQFRQNVAFNTGRRDASSGYYGSRYQNTSRNATQLNNRGRSSSYSRSIRNVRSSGDSYGRANRTVGRDYDSYRRTNTYDTRRSTMNNRTTRSSDTYSRSQQMPARNTGSARSMPTTRSSGTMRSSGGGGGRSSGGGGGSSRGRGN